MTPRSPMASTSSAAIRHGCALAIVATLAGTPVLFGQAPPPPATPKASPAAVAAKPPVGAKGFATAKAAAEALIQAASTFDVNALVSILGPDGTDLVSSQDSVQDRNLSLAFAAKANEAQAVVVNPSNPARATLVVGAEQWPLPVPLVRISGKWYFNAKAGRDEVLFRRVGANELDAIDVCRGFVEAQKDYALDVHDNSGVHQYAQRIISTPGTQDGLYWKNADGSPGGPISEAVAIAIQEGYGIDKMRAYHGYYFQVLKGQGPAARLGQLDYVIGGIMIGGFALIATPADYGVTGVQTFIVSHDGIVYQKDLGPDSLNLAKQIDRYNPDSTWHRTNDGWK
jgi:hypothetical protein